MKLGHYNRRHCRYRRAPEERCLRHRVGDRHVTPKRVLHSNFGCCIGTIQKSAAYKISGAAERRTVPIRELVENKRQQLKKKLSSGTTPHLIHEVQAAARGPFEVTSEVIMIAGKTAKRRSAIPKMSA